MKKLFGRGLLVLALLATALSFAMPANTSAQSGTTVVVRPGYMNGWAFIDDNGAGGVGEMIYGPAPAPAGDGSAHFVLTKSSQGYMITTAQYRGVKIADISTLKYSTYRSGDPGAQLVVLQLNIDVDSDDDLTEWQGRLLFEPYHDAVVESNTWQDWNTLGDIAGWWFSKPPGNEICSQSDPCTWQEVKSNFPRAQIHPSLGGIVFKAGSGWQSFDGNVDNLVFGVNGVNTTYDFEPPVPCDWTTTNTVKTLQGDCSTNQRIHLEDGFTYDGNGHTIAAYGQLSSRIVEAYGEEDQPAISVNLRNLTVKIDRVDIAKPTGDVIAIGFQNVNGMITNNNVVYIDRETDDAPYAAVGIYAAIGDIEVSGNSASGFDIPIINAYDELCYTVWNGALRLPTSGCAPWEKSRNLAAERSPGKISFQFIPMCIRDNNGLARYEPTRNCDTLWSWWSERKLVTYPSTNLISICVNDDTGRVRVVDVGTSCQLDEWAGQI